MVGMRRVIARLGVATIVVASSVMFVASAAHADPAGTIVEFPVTANSSPVGAAADPSGSIWFTEQTAGAIGRLVPATGAVTDFAIAMPNPGPTGIVLGPDGNMWFTEVSGNKDRPHHHERNDHRV
jgi:streptogramin lyase